MTNGRVDYPCPICGDREAAVLYPDTLGQELPRFGYDFTPQHMRTYRVLLCRPCRHAFASPRPERLGERYQDVEDPAYLEWQAERLVAARRVLGRIASKVPSGRLLDVGCATGDFLSAAAGRYQAEGMEMSDWAAGIARKRGLTVHRAHLADFRPGSPYDVLTLWGVIEHFEDPAAEVRRMPGLLREEGRVCLWTGDRDSWVARFLGRRWWYVQGQHLQMFSRTSLEKLFAQSGFETEWIGDYPVTMTLRAVEKSLQRYPLAGKIFSGLPLPKRLRDQVLNLRIPGEMFAVFKRKAQPR